MRSSRLTVTNDVLARLELELKIIFFHDDYISIPHPMRRTHWLINSSSLLFRMKDNGLSKQRAQFVAEQFKRRGLTPGVVTGFGATIPLHPVLPKKVKRRTGV